MELTEQKMSTTSTSETTWQLLSYFRPFYTVFNEMVVYRKTSHTGHVKWPCSLQTNLSFWPFELLSFENNQWVNCENVLIYIRVLTINRNHCSEVLSIFIPQCSKRVKYISNSKLFKYFITLTSLIKWEN